MLLSETAGDRAQRRTFRDGHAALGEHVHALRRADGALAGGEAKELAAHVAGAAERQQRRVRAGQWIAAHSICFRKLGSAWCQAWPSAFRGKLATAVLNAKRCRI